MKQRDAGNTGRANYSVPASRLNTSFFDSLRWQKRTPAPGGIGASSLVFFDGVGPGGADLLVGGFHWPKGVQSVDRHTGKLLWANSIPGGETIGGYTPSFSKNGSVIYVANDATPHPQIAFSSVTGPSVYWDNSSDDAPVPLIGSSSKVAPDGRIFTHGWCDAIGALTDDGGTLRQTWTAATSIASCWNGPTLLADTERMLVVSGGRAGLVVAFDGDTGSEVWRVNVGIGTDADATIDPANGNIYLPAGFDNIAVVGLSRNGAPLWTAPVLEVSPRQGKVRRVQGAGCLSHDASTYYFQTVSEQGDGALYAIRTVNGSVKWVYPTASRGNEGGWSSPVVTSNSVIVVGNNLGGTYYALRDAGSFAQLLDTLSTSGTATASATLSPDGLLYLPARMPWLQTNGDSETPSNAAENLFNAFNLEGVDGVALPAPKDLQGQQVQQTIRLRWQAQNNSGFAFYAIYRATAPFTSIAGMTPFASVTNQNSVEYVDSKFSPGQAYFYAVTTVSTSGDQNDVVDSVGPITPFVATVDDDVSIGWIQRLPSLNYVWNSPNPARDGWPAEGSNVTWRAMVKSWYGSARNNIKFRWLMDDAIIASGTVSLAPQAWTGVDLVVPWTVDRHQLRFEIDTTNTLTEFSESNNSLAIWTDSITVGFWVEQTVYNYFHKYQHQLGDGANSWEDWAQRQVARWNDMFAVSVDSVDAPLGALDRIRLDKITVVPDGALPLAGGLSSNNPDNRDRTTDLVWGFPASSGTNGFYANHLDAKDGNPFWYEGSLIHELGHARYLIDTYGFNVVDRASDPKVLVRHNGAPIGGTPWLPRSFPWWDHVSISVGGTDNPFFGLMGGYYSMVDRYSVMALNRIAHQRAILGNYNAPGNIGVFINDLPASNQVQLLDGWGNTIGNAGVTIYRATGSPEWYGKRFQDSPALTFTADSVGRVNVGRNPFANGPLQHTFGISTMEALVKVESGGRVGFAFLAAGLFNMEFWRGHTNQGRYSLIVPMLGAQREFAIVRSWPDGTGWRVQVVVGGETQPNSVLVGNISAFYQEGSWWAWSPTDMAGQLVTATWPDSFSVEQRMPVTRHPLKASWATVMSSGDRKNVQISTPSLNGYVYELQTSPDLEEWTLAPEGRLFGTGQPVEWPQPTVAPHNFYRFVIRQLGR